MVPARAHARVSLPRRSGQPPSALAAVNSRQIYEYVRFSAWLLILAERHSASANLLRGSGADVVDPEDIDAITSVIRQRYEDFRKGTHPTPVNWDGRFDRTAPARLMFQHLDLATRPRPRKGSNLRSSEWFGSTSERAITFATSRTMSLASRDSSPRAEHRHTHSRQCVHGSRRPHRHASRQPAMLQDRRPAR